MPVSKPVLGNCNGYTVQASDTLFSVAAMFQVGGWTAAVGGWAAGLQQVWVVGWTCCKPGSQLEAGARQSGRR